MAVCNRAEPSDAARAGDPRVVEPADAGLAEPLGERSISGDSPYRGGGPVDIWLSPDLAPRSGIFLLPYRHQLIPQPAPRDAARRRASAVARCRPSAKARAGSANGQPNTG